MDFAKIRAVAKFHTDPLTRVPEDELVASKQYLDPLAFVEIKTEVKVSYTVLSCIFLCILCESFYHHYRDSLAIKLSLSHIGIW
jgi:hypothetical protein